MTYNNCVKQIMADLHALPPVWAEKIACNICKLIDTQDECNPVDPDCDAIRDCQTVTSLSTWTVDEDIVCISYTDEHGVTVKRCFQFSFLNDAINDTDGTCLTPLWGTLPPRDKWQAIIDKICDCCNGTTTTTTTSSTTTTTTAGPCDCFTWEVTNVDSSPHDVTYNNCQDVEDPDTTVTLDPGETVRFCSCFEDIIYDPQYLVLVSIADVCIPTPLCESCNQYVIANSNPFPVEVFYTDCATLLPASIWAMPAVKNVITCACTDSVELTSGITIGQTLPCPDQTTSTTTTTTEPPCICYSIRNEGGPDRWVDYVDCDGMAQSFTVASGETTYVCAQSGSISTFGVMITSFGACVANCPPTTTTTTTSTTTTTTTAPTTTTTTTTSTTTTTTAAIEQDIVYFTNHPTNGDRGAKIWFSQNDYYTPNTPASLIPANCLNPGNLGITPNIYIKVNYWRDDISGSIDDGFGSVRTPDGTKTITIPTDLLTYNVSSGAWQRSTGIWTLDEGANIAAFEITEATDFYTVFGVTHQILLPPYHHFIRVHNTFDAGLTGVTWFDLV